MKERIRKVMGKILFLGIAVLYSSIVLTACAPKAAPLEKPVSPEVPAAASAGKSTSGGWEEEWQKTLAAAKKEGKVVLYGGDISGEMRHQLSEAFTDKYGLVIEIEIARGTLLTERVARERKTGLYLPDLVSGGLGTSLFNTYKPGGMVLPMDPFLVLPEVKDPQHWWNGLRFNDKDRTTLAFNAYVTLPVAINTELVRDGELKSYADLLQPKWKGRILMNDPMLPGTANRWMGFVIKTMGAEYLRELARQEPTIIRDERLHTEWLARGKFPIATTPLTTPFTEFLRLGAPIKRIEMAEGAHLTSGIACIVVMNNAPHPNAAKVFLNWLLSKEGQTLWSRLIGTQSARLDVAADFLPPDVVRKPGVKYLDQNSEDYILQEPEFTRIAKEIFGPLIR